MTNNDFAQHINRRTFLGRGAAGLGLVALNSLINPRLLAAQTAYLTSKGVVSPLDFPPKAKRDTRPAAHRTSKRSTTSPNSPR